MLSSEGNSSTQAACAYNVSSTAHPLASNHPSRHEVRSHIREHPSDYYAMMALGKPINPGVWAYGTPFFIPNLLQQVAPDTADLFVLPGGLAGEDRDDAEADDCLARNVFGTSSLAGFSSYEQEQAEEGLIKLVCGLSPQAGYPYSRH